MSASVSLASWWIRSATYWLCQISPVPELGRAANVSFITGIASAPGDPHERMLILVDIDILISSADVGLHEMELN